MTKHKQNLQFRAYKINNVPITKKELQRIITKSNNIMLNYNVDVWILKRIGNQQGIHSDTTQQQNSTVFPTTTQNIYTIPSWNTEIVYVVEPNPVETVAQDVVIVEQGPIQYNQYNQYNQPMMINPNNMVYLADNSQYANKDSIEIRRSIIRMLIIRNC